MGMLSDSLAIKLTTYDNYSRELLLANGGITRHLEILTADKPTPIKIIKALLFVHAWLQTTTTLDNVQPFYNFMGHILKVAVDLGKKASIDR